MNEELAKFENDVGEAVEAFLDDIATGLNLPNFFDFTQERIAEKVTPEALDPKTKCPLYNYKTKTQVCFPRICVDWCDGVVGRRSGEPPQVRYFPGALGLPVTMILPLYTTTVKDSSWSTTLKTCHHGVLCTMKRRFSL